MRRLAAIAVLLGGALALTSCATGVESTVDIELSLEDAKQSAMALELEIAALVPPDAAGQPEQSPDGILMNCGDGGHRWTVGTTVPLREPIDAEAFVTSVIEHYGESDELEAVSIPRKSGEPRVQVLGPFGSSVIASENRDRTAIRISSFSACFKLPDGVSPLGRH